jgi:hypothetical protein
MEYSEHQGGLEEELTDAQLSHLIPGQTLFLRDPRNTPVRVRSCTPETASFVVCVSDFEDAGAEWVLPLWDVAKFRVALGAERLRSSETNTLAQSVAEFDLITHIPVNSDVQRATKLEIEHCQNDIAAALDQNFFDLPTNTSTFTSGEEPSDQWGAALESILNARGVLDLDREFAGQYASNPHAGEIIKGHRIVLAELGLVPYQGHIVRDPATFEERWAKPYRRNHILTRLAFMRAMLSKLGLLEVPLYRTIYSDIELRRPENRGFVSSTLRHEVAASLFASGQRKRVSATFWQRVGMDRVFMSYFETPQLSQRYQEAEVILLFDEANAVF